MESRLTVIVSSTTLDLYEHRFAIQEACLKADCFPKMMEHLDAEDVGAVAKSIAMVDGADVYVCVLASRYGTVPRGGTLSITELEFERAIERSIEVLAFLMHEDHPMKRAWFEESRTAQRRMAKFKKRVSAGRIVKTFASADELKALVISALDRLQQRRLAEEHTKYKELLAKHVALAAEVDSLKQRLPPRDDPSPQP